jgi:FkbM family methyltransferase
MERLHFLERTRNAGETMGMISSSLKSLIRNARLAYDDVRQTFIENFMGPTGLAKVPAGWFKDGIAIVTPNEVNDRHGTGVIIRRCFDGIPGILSIRSTNLHSDHQFGDFAFRFAHQGLPREESYRRLLEVLRGNSFKYVICVPYLEDELVTAIILKEAFGAKLCIYVMDDNHLEGGQIPEVLMWEALEKADLRLAISPEMRDAYENKFRRKFWLRPPVVTPASVASVPRIPPDEALTKCRGIVVGSLWSTQALNRLASSVSAAALQVDWFGNANASWLQYNIDELAAKGVIVRGFVPESELAQKIRDYAYALVPSGTLEADDLRADLAKYSLPTRMPFLLAVGNIPTIVLGNRLTAAAGFVERFRVGKVVSYSGSELRAAVSELCSAPVQAEIRSRAAGLAESFSALGVGQWILAAMDAGKPEDETLEWLMPRRRSDFAYYLEPPVPSGTAHDYVTVYQSLERLKRRGFDPDFVLDVGASTGIWSISVNKLFPKSRFLLIEPLLDLYDEKIQCLKRLMPAVEIIGVAVGAHVGTVAFKVSSDLCGSSLLDVNNGRDYRVEKIPMTTLDQIAAEKMVRGRGLLKLDVQRAEHIVLAGARQILPQVDVVIAELSLYREAENGKTLLEMLALFDAEGFRYYDDGGEWRSPLNGTLLQKDVVFVRNDLFPADG